MEEPLFAAKLFVQLCGQVAGRKLSLAIPQVNSHPMNTCKSKNEIGLPIPVHVSRPKSNDIVGNAEFLAGAKTPIPLSKGHPNIQRGAASDSHIQKSVTVEVAHGNPVGIGPNLYAASRNKSFLLVAVQQNHGIVAPQDNGDIHPPIPVEIPNRQVMRQAAGAIVPGFGENASTLIQEDGYLLLPKTSHGNILFAVPVQIR
jgi:hypothetical protein